MSSLVKLLLLSIISCSLPSLVSSHGYLFYPMARNGNTAGSRSNPTGKTSGMPSEADLNACGSTTVPDVGPQPIRATWAAGQSVELQWNTTILHLNPPGVRIAIQYSNADTFNDNILYEGLDIGQIGINQIDMQIPVEKASESAIVQWIWTSNSDGGWWVGCSDIIINTDPLGIIPPPELAPTLDPSIPIHIVSTKPAIATTPTKVKITQRRIKAVKV